MWENKNVYGMFPQIFLFFPIPCLKCLWKISIGISIDIFIFPYSLPQMSMESFHGYFHRYSYFQGGMWENKNIYGKFPDISLYIFIFLHSLPQMSMESFHGHSGRYTYFQERMWENKNVCGNFP
jgi:hypothetical protein